ncbi:MAG: molybdopterin molybdenumtransferase MoeA [Nitrospirae bacterium]|nr:molybdopterin molybdenumtransferase MoeA [Nitrospirota bacterium]
MTTDDWISPESAWQRLAEHCSALEREDIDRRSALGRVLAEPLTATVDVPPADVSAMDGFVVSDEVAAGDCLAISGVIPAGAKPDGELEPGCAMRIMTGAPIPRGADRVVPVEQTTSTRDEVLFRSGTDVGAHIRRRAEIQRTGDPLLPAGSLLTAGGLSLLATHGIATVPVHRRPRVAFLATGDEVVPPDTDPLPGQLRDSHTDFLLAAGSSLGVEVEPLGIAADRPEDLRERIGAGMEADVLLIGGGVSKGDYDFVEEVLADLGCEVLFDAVAVQPGKPLVAAHHAGGLVLGLPGNPASVLAGFYLFVRPALRRLMGLRDSFWHGALAGELTASLPAAKGRDRFVTAEVEFREGRLLVEPLAPKGSHDLAAFARGAGLVRVRAHSPEALPGQACEVLPLANWPSTG